MSAPQEKVPGQRPCSLEPVSLHHRKALAKFIRMFVRCSALYALSCGAVRRALISVIMGVPKALIMKQSP